MKDCGIKCIEIKGCNTRNIAGFVQRRREKKEQSLKGAVFIKKNIIIQDLYNKYNTIYIYELYIK